MADRKKKAAADTQIQKLYKTYYTSLYKFCLSKIRSNNHIIDDITQEAFLVLYNKLLGGEKIKS